MNVEISIKADTGLRFHAIYHDVPQILLLDISQVLHMKCGAKSLTIIKMITKTNAHLDFQPTVSKHKG